MRRCRIGLFSSIFSSADTRPGQCYDRPSPGRILAPKDPLSLLQGATIEVRSRVPTTPPTLRSASLTAPSHSCFGPTTGCGTARRLWR